MSFYMKLAQTEEMRTVIKITELNLQLTDLLHSHLELLIRQSKKLGITFPELERTIELMRKEKTIVESITRLSDQVGAGLSPETDLQKPPPDLKHHLKNPSNPEDDNGTVSHHRARAQRK